MRIVSASGNPSGMDVVLQNAGVTYRLFPNAVLQDVAAWRSSMLTVQERHGEEAGPVTVVFRSARGCVNGSQVPFSDDLWYAARMHEGRHHHICAVGIHVARKQRPPSCALVATSEETPEWYCSLIMFS